MKMKNNKMKSKEQMAERKRSRKVSPKKTDEKIEYEIEEEEIMVRLFEEIFPSLQVGWEKWAQEFNEWLPEGAGSPQTLASLKKVV